MKLITEITEELKCLVEEKKQGEKQYYIEGVFLQSDRQNRNGRIYPQDMLAGKINEYNETYVKQNRAFGELGHPDSPSINLDRVSHMIKELRQEGTDWIGKAKIMDTPYGKIVKSLIDEGAKLGVSSRGMGSLKENRQGIAVVQDDFILATAADIVADPSAPDAFVRGIMENKEWFYVDGKFVEQDVEQAKQNIKRATSGNLVEAQAKEFAKFLAKIR